MDIDETIEELTDLVCDKAEFVRSVREALQQARRSGMEETIKISDAIEGFYTKTEFDEWRAFKHFRNSMREMIKHENSLDAAGRKEDDKEGV